MEGFLQKEAFHSFIKKMPINQYITVALATALKFIAGPFTGLVLGLDWVETAICTIIGAMSTIFLVAILGEQLLKLINKYRKIPPQKFSKRSRMTVRVWKRFGMMGIACLTPIIFTPIGGTLIAIFFKVPLPKLLFNMLIFCVLWGFIFSFLVFKLPDLRAYFLTFIL